MQNLIYLIFKSLSRTTYFKVIFYFPSLFLGTFYSILDGVYFVLPIHLIKPSKSSLVLYFLNCLPHSKDQSSYICWRISTSYFFVVDIFIKVLLCSGLALSRNRSKSVLLLFLCASSPHVSRSILGSLQYLSLFLDGIISVCSTNR